MSGCLGRSLQKKLSSVAKAPVKTFEFQLCSVLTLLRQGEQGTGGSQPEVWPCHFPEAGGFWIIPRTGGAGGLPQCRAMCRAVPCRLLLTTRRGDAGCEAGAGWKGASCNQELYCGCWAACAMQHLGDKAQKSARLSGDAGGDLGEGDAGGSRLAGDGERAKGERA